MSKPAADSYDFAAYVEAWRSARRLIFEVADRWEDLDEWLDAIPDPDRALIEELDPAVATLQKLRTAATALTDGTEPSDASRKG